jgi:hypothetical protein
MLYVLVIVILLSSSNLSQSSSVTSYRNECKLASINSTGSFSKLPLQAVLANARIFLQNRHATGPYKIPRQKMSPGNAYVGIWVDC